MATFYGIGRALGFSHDELVDRLNPQSRGKFMCGEEVGLGSAFRATIAFLGSLTVKDNWEFDTWGEAMQNNPLVRYLRSRAAPGPTSTLIDFITGEDFIGMPVGINEFVSDPRRSLEYSSDKFLPLNIEAILEAEGTKEKAIAGVVETFGGRAYPRSPYARLEELWAQKRAEMPPEYGVAPANLQDADDVQRRWFYGLRQKRSFRDAWLPSLAQVRSSVASIRTSGASGASAPRSSMERTLTATPAATWSGQQTSGGVWS
ncbi:MAG: hypothetical protein AMJ38_00505 [Dehalococcoidia bacterium DG_22]|nr:MAG: hypothetical protein AMJ38_00505 [Dehalococcoidia bacterium DG_22]